MSRTVSQGLFSIYSPASNVLLQKPQCGPHEAYWGVFQPSFYMLLLLFPLSSWGHWANPRQHGALAFRFATQLTQLPGRSRKKKSHNRIFFFFSPKTRFLSMNLCEELLLKNSWTLSGWREWGKISGGLYWCAWSSQTHRALFNLYFLLMVCILLTALRNTFSSKLGLRLLRELYWCCKTDRKSSPRITVHVQVCRPAIHLPCFGHVPFCGISPPLDLWHKGQSIFYSHFAFKYLWSLNIAVRKYVLTFSLFSSG